MRLKDVHSLVTIATADIAVGPQLLASWSTIAQITAW